MTYISKEEAIIAIETELKKDCYDLDLTLTSHDNVGFWKGYNYALSLINYLPEKSKYETAKEVFDEFYGRFKNIVPETHEYVEWLEEKIKTN